MLFQTSLGIDIQDHSVSLAYLKASFKGVRLVAHAVYPIKEVDSFKEKMDLMGASVRDFLRKNNISPTAVFLGMPRNTAILRYLEFPLAVKENLRDSVGYGLEKYIPIPAEEIYFDYQVVGEDKDSGKLKLLLVAAKKEMVDPYLDLATHIGVEISGIEISSTAVANYFSNQKDSIGAGTCAVVCLRDDHLELSGLKAGFLDYSRWIGRGEWGNDLPGRISRELHKLKDRLGKGGGRLNVVFCVSDESAELVNAFTTDENFEIRFVDISRSGIPSPALIPAYGLALRGIKNLVSDINLLPKPLRKRPNKAGYYAMVALAGLLVVLALAWGGGSIISQQLHLGRLNAEIARLGVEVGNIEEIKTKYKKMEDEIQYLSGLYGASIPILEVFKELSVRIPKTAWVRQLTFSGDEVRINGYADSSSELIPSLESSPLFMDVAFLSSITKPRSGAGKEVFQIGLKVAKRESITH